MHRYDELTDKVVLREVNRPRLEPSYNDLVTERRNSASNPTADSPAMSNSSGSRGVLRQALADLDLNSQVPNVDNGMTFSQLLRSGSAATIGDAQAAVVYAGVDPLCAGLAGHVTNRGRAGGAGHAAAQYRHPKRLGTGGGGRRTAHGGGVAASSGDIGVAEGDHVDDGDENSIVYPLKEDEEGKAITKVALTELETMQEVGAMTCMFGMYYDSTFMNKTKKRKTGLSRHDWVMSTLENPSACFDMFRMRREVFLRLHDLLVLSYGLKSTKKMNSMESLAMFFWMIGAPQSMRQAENRFERSKETISRKFDEVLQSIYKLSVDIVKPKDPEFKEVHLRLKSSRFSPYFDNCIGAIDGTHVPVIVPAPKVLQHVGRHGYTTQNVLAICDFDMRFTFAVAGWPGSAHDMRVFNDAIRKYGDKFPHPPPGKFYLVDSGYPNRPGYLAPYRGTKYHIPEYRQGSGPSGKKEVFNYLHSSLRNVIERSFGVLK